MYKKYQKMVLTYMYTKSNLENLVSMDLEHPCETRDLAIILQDLGF